MSMISDSTLSGQIKGTKEQKSKQLIKKNADNLAKGPIRVYKIENKQTKTEKHN